MTDVVGVQLKADTHDFVKGFNDASSAVSNFGKGIGAIKGTISSAISSEMGHLKNTALATGAALLATGIRVKGALSSFNQLETRMKNVATVADTSVMSLGKLTDGVRSLAISGKVSTDVNDLSEGLYNIVSSGFQGADAMKILNTSAQAASAGLTSTLVAGTAVTQILNAYGMSASSAANVSDILFHTVNVGVLNFEQLANTTGQWAANAAALKIPIGEATAALAAMTKAGSDADMAATSLRTMMLAFINPSDAMSKTLAKIGVSSGQALLAQKGLAGGLQAVVSATDGSASSLQGLFQDVQGLQGVLQLTGAQAGFFASQAKLMSSAQGVAGEASKALATQQEALGAQWQQLKNQLTEIKLELGSMLQPIAKFVVGVGTNMVGAVNSLPGPLREVIAGFSLLTPAIAVLSAAWVVHAAKAWAVGKAVTGLITPLRGLAVVGRTPLLGKGLDTIESVARRGVFRTIASHIKEVISGSTTLRSAFTSLAGSTLVAVGAIAAFAVVLNTLWTNYNKANEAGKKLAITMSQGANAADPTTFKDLTAQINAAKNAYDQLQGGFSGLGGALKAAYGGVQLVNPIDDNTIGRDISASEQAAKNYTALVNAQNAAVVMANRGESAQAAWNRMIDAGAKGAIDLQAVIDATSQRQVLITKMFSGKTLNPQEASDMERLNGIINTARDSLSAFGKVQEDTAVKAAHATSAELTLSDAMAKFSDASLTAKDRAQAYGDILDGLISKQTGTRNAQAAVGDALRGFIQTMSDLKAAGTKIGPDLFNPFTEGGSKVQSALSSVSQSMSQWAQSIFNTTGDAAKANQVLAETAGGFIKVAQGAGFSASQIEAMLQLMGLTPETVSTLVQIPGADAALAMLGSIQEQMAAVDGTVATATVQLVFSPAVAGSVAGQGSSLRAAGVEDATTSASDFNASNIPSKSPTDQIHDIITQLMAGITSGIGDASKGFTPKTSGGGGGGSKAEDTKLTPQEAAGYAYEAGFRGTDLVRIVAIMGRESGYNPKAFNGNAATGDLSYGLAQINMIGSLGPQRRAAMGLGTNEELFDPLTNMRAAFQMYQESGNKLTPWGGYKGESDTFNTDMGTAQAAVEAFLQNQGKFSGAGGGLSDGFAQMIRKGLTDGLGKVAADKFTADSDAYTSVIQNMAGGFSRVGQGIINDALTTGNDPTDEFKKVADSYSDLTKKVGKDTAVQLLYWAGNADEYTKMADEIIHQSELLVSKEDYQFGKGQISADDYKAILNKRLSMTEQYSSEWISIMNQLDGVQKAADDAQNASFSKDKDLTEKKYTLKEIDRKAYIAYLTDLLSHLVKYSDDYMEVWGKLNDMQKETADQQKEIANQIKDAWKTAFDAVADPIKSATSLVGAFGGQLDVTADSITGFYQHMQEGTKRWVDAITTLKNSGIDPGLLSDLIHEGPQSLSLAETIVGMGQSGIDFINGSLSDIGNMTTGFASSMIPQASIGQMVDNSVHVSMGDFSLDIPDNLGLTRDDVLGIVNSALAAAVAAAQTGVRAP